MKFPALLKFGCAILQRAGLSLRPEIVKIPCTPPFAEPSGFRTILTSRIGPLIERNDGTVLPGAMKGARVTCGLPVRGLEPPGVGNAWHPPQESRLKRGPRPFATDSTSANVGAASE